MSVDVDIKSIRIISPKSNSVYGQCMVCGSIKQLIGSDANNLQNWGDRHIDMCERCKCPRSYKRISERDFGRAK